MKLFRRILMAIGLASAPATSSIPEIEQTAKPIPKTKHRHSGLPKAKSSFKQNQRKQRNASKRK